MRSHNHHHEKVFVEEISTSRLLITIILNFLITIVEIIGGIFSGSLSLISDALHNFSDGIAVILSYLAVKLSRLPKNSQYTFGYKRAEILTAVFNASVLIGISLYLFFEAYNRFLSPSEIDGSLMVTVASVGLLANIAGTLLLKKDSKNSLNIRTAYLHLFSDAVSSAGVIIGGLAIFYYNISWVDPLLTVLISVYIIKESYDVVKESVTVLMMAVPPDISVPDIIENLMKIEEIENIHHVHVWRIDERDIHFEAHVEVPDLLVSRTEEILSRIESILNHDFHIRHVTIQFECDRCGVSKESER